MAFGWPIFITFLKLDKKLDHGLILLKVYIFQFLLKCSEHTWFHSNKNKATISMNDIYHFQGLRQTNMTNCYNSLDRKKSIRMDLCSSIFSTNYSVDVSRSIEFIFFFPIQAFVFIDHKNYGQITTQI